MANKVYLSKTTLTGGSATALDSIDGNTLVDGDMAHMFLGGTLYVYRLNASSSAAEDSPFVITPDANAGTKRWELYQPGLVGEGKVWFLATAPAGWLFADGKTIGDAASGGTARANADTEALFSALWADYDNTKLVIQDASGTPTTRGVSAAADFAAHKRLPLPNLCSRMPIGVGTGSGLTARALGEVGGAETHVQSLAELAAHTHTFDMNNQTVGGNPVAEGGGSENVGFAGTTSQVGSGSPMDIMNPFVVVNYIIKH